MDVICRVNINCNHVELRAFIPFVRALAFCEYFADVTIYCIDDGHNLQFVCSPERPDKLTWRELRDRWIAKYGPL